MRVFSLTAFFIRRFALSPLFSSWVLQQPNKWDDNSSNLPHEVAQLRDGQRKLELQLMQTSMRLAAYNEDVLSEAFDKATTETCFWLPTLQPDQSQAWSGLIEEGDNETYWDSYKVLFGTRHERKPK